MTKRQIQKIPRTALLFVFFPYHMIINESAPQRILDEHPVVADTLRKLTGDYYNRVIDAFQYSTYESGRTVNVFRGAQTYSYTKLGMDINSASFKIAAFNRNAEEEIHDEVIMEIIIT